ncbi:hypothetical protein V8Z80_07960 [Orrella sp. JC864]|uniref:general secretion pathway protein n=1 Tax=Orrella sp. JC864 TaxID=3120298 RepID=UPI0012BC6077
MIAARLASGMRAIWRAHAATVLRRSRGDYYEYLSERLQAGNGGKTLLALFLDDAARHGPHTARGLLSAHWASLCQEQGADVHAIWQGVFPEEELLLLRIAQQAGAKAFVQTLAELAGAVRLVGQVRALLAGTLGVALAALAVMLATLAAVPYYTAPRLRQAFQGLAPEHYGPGARLFHDFAQALQQGWPWLALGIALAVAAGLASLPRYTGRLRPWLDRLPPWSVYRDFQALRFLALLALLLRRQGHRVMALGEALARIAGGSAPWMAWQAQRMGERMDEGERGAGVFDTGLLDASTRWFMQDMIEAYGMDEGVRRARLRLETHARRRIQAQAQAWRWLLLLGALACLLALAGWHYAVIDEMRRALLLRHAGV